MPKIKSAQTPPSILTLILLTALSTLSLNMFLPSLAHIAQDLEADYGVTSLAVGAYLAVASAMLLIIGPLSDRLGRRPVLLGGLVVFTLASLVCALANSIWVFLAFRMLQGGVVAGYAMSMAIVRDTRSQREAAGLIAYISMAMAIAPMLGPMLGGALDAAFGWRSNFYVYAGTGFLVLVLCWLDLGETRSPASGSRLPVLDLLREPRFWAYSSCSLFSVGAFYVFLTGAPLVAKVTFGVSAAELGLFVGSISAGFILGGFISGRLAAHLSPTSLILAGRLVACLGLSIGIVICMITTVSPLVYFAATIFVGFGNGLTMPNSNAAALSVRPEYAGSAAGVSAAMVMMGGAVLTSVTGVLLPADSPEVMLLVLMLVSSGLGLVALLLAMRLERGG